MNDDGMLLFRSLSKASSFGSMGHRALGNGATGGSVETHRHSLQTYPIDIFY